MLSFAAIVVALHFVGVDINIALACATLTVSASGAVVGRVATELKAAGQVTERMIVLTTLNTLFAVLVHKLIIGWLHVDQAGNWVQAIAQPLYTFGGSALIALALAKVVALVMRRFDLRDENSVLLLLGLILLALTLGPAAEPVDLAGAAAGRRDPAQHHRTAVGLAAPLRHRRRRAGADAVRDRRRRVVGRPASRPACWPASRCSARGRSRSWSRCSRWPTGAASRCARASRCR